MAGGHCVWRAHGPWRPAHLHGGRLHAAAEVRLRLAANGIQVMDSKGLGALLLKLILLALAPPHQHLSVRIVQEPCMRAQACQPLWVREALMRGATNGGRWNGSASGKGIGCCAGSPLSRT